jgi:ABC-type nitrate/sulfonate/bicarbonate transport system substrate-binding protein
MSDYQPLEIRVFYRSHTHLPVWEVVEQAGIWKELNVKAAFEYCDSSSVAEAALFDGSVQYVSGNHISPYGLVAKGKPIVSLASPSNSVNDKLISRAPVKSIGELKGKRLADTTVLDSGGGYNHIRGNHMMYVLRAGMRLDDVKWIEIADIMSEEFRGKQMEAVKEGKADAAMATGAAEKFQREGFHVLELGRLPMVNGPTLTSTLTTLRGKDRLAERLVKALVMGIAYARQHQEETERILADLRRRVPESNATYNSVAKLLAKPYPDHEAIANAYELCCMKDPKAKELSPVSLWDLHYLRELDVSGFIDGLYTPAR